MSPAILLWLGATMAIGLFSGCETVVLTNLTAPSFAENPSQIYTITASFRASSQVETATIRPRIIIDGSAYASLGVLYHKVTGWPLGFGDKAKHYEKKIFLKRLGEPEDCAGAFVFLLSDMALYITGQCLAVDGGLTATY